MFTNLKRIQNDIEQLSTFNSTPKKGLTRLSFSQEDRGARNYIINEYKTLGLKVREDAAGTIVARLDGELNDAPVVMIGSHFDSVISGGNFDGNAGVVAALETARTMVENNIKPKYPVEFIAMIEEEGCRFGGGLFASKAMVGKVSRETLDKFKDKNGISIASAMKDFGFDPDKIHEAIRKAEDVKAFLELHIEQGPVLENNKKEIGIVDYIVGIEEFEVTINGRPDHAGTTPMNMRADALAAASQVLYKIPTLAIEAGEGTVATVGKLTVQPGAGNIVPGVVKFTVDIRSKNEQLMNQVHEEIVKLLKESTTKEGCSLDVVQLLYNKPVKLDDQIIKDLKNICEELNLSNQIILSGAGHDAMVMADITKIGMIFVPSKGGRSHCPEEWTEYEQLHKGVEIMYHEVLNLSK